MDREGLIRDFLGKLLIRKSCQEKSYLYNKNEEKSLIIDQI